MMNIDTRARYTLRLPDKLMDMLHKTAKESGLSVNALIVEILQEWMDDHDTQGTHR